MERSVKMKLVQDRKINLKRMINLYRKKRLIIQRGKNSLLQVRMMEERLVKGEYCLSTSGVGSPPHSLPSTSGTQNDKIEDVHCACISKLETQVEEQVNEMETSVFRIEEKHFESLSEKLEIPPPPLDPELLFPPRIRRADLVSHARYFAE